MNTMVHKALDNIDVSYMQLMEIANDIFSQTTSELDALMQEAYSHIEGISNDSIRDLMLKLSLRSYRFSEIKEKAAFKAALGEMLRKEAYAGAYNQAEGTAHVRESTAILNTSAEILAEEIYSMVASMLKTKLEECHKVVDTLKSVLMTRLQEAKLAAVDTQ